MALCVAICFLIAGSHSAASPPPNVYVVVVDGGGAILGSASKVPQLWHRLETMKRGVFFRHAQACMPTVTNTNHVSFVTGVYPIAHGITGDAFWNRESHRSTQMDQATMIEVNTIFHSLNDSSGGVSAAIFGKSKLATLLGGTNPLSTPSVVWGDVESEARPGHPPMPGSDNRTIDRAIEAITKNRPVFMLVNLGDVDRYSHRYGPESSEARAAIANVDRGLAHLIDFIHSLPSWDKTVIILTADHGIGATTEPRNARARSANFEADLQRQNIQGLSVVTDGGVASVYVDSALSGDRLPEQAQLLRRARLLALIDPNIAQALYRILNPADPSQLAVIDVAHPDWKISNVRIGDLFLVARSGTALTRDAPSLGIHGGPAERSIGIGILGGFPLLKDWSADDVTVVNAPDIGMTARSLLHLPAPKYLNGSPVPSELCGRVIKEAFVH